MQINNILIDILDWVRKLVWWREHKVEYAPYEVISIENTLYGLLKEVTRDTPRAVCTYILTPFAPPKYAKDTHKDFHICLDHLWKLDASEYEFYNNKDKIPHKAFKLSKKSKKSPYATHTVLVKPKSTHSHCITILKANRWVNENGSYGSNVIYQGYYDFIGRSFYGYRDRWAIPIFKDLINEIKTKDISVLDINDIIEQSRKKYLGYGYKPNTGLYYEFRDVENDKTIQ